MGSLAFTSSKVSQQSGYFPTMPGVTHVPYPNDYRPLLAGDDQGQAVLDYIEQVLFEANVPAKEVAAILRGISRASDHSFRLREHDLAARYGGDEFVLILPETPKTGTTAKAERLRVHMQNCQFPNGLRVTLSVGVATYPDDGFSRDALIHAADTALYAAKRLGRNRVMSYSATLAPANAPRPTVEMPAEKLLALERSINEELFDTVYQPVVDVQSRSLFGYEAFGRPTDPCFEEIVEVLAIAERAGQVVELGQVLRRKAIAPMEGMATGACLFVNLHPHELYDASLLLEDGPFAPFRERVVLELNQSGSMTDHTKLQEVVRNLRSFGFRIALDNLPATYAGLSALTQVTVDFVKLHRSLLRGVQDDIRRGRLLQHLLELARDEEMLVVAEGIETREQYDACLDLGFGLMQGFFFGPGQPPFADVAIPEVAASKSSNRGAAR
jgi:EAL domain-containing protein (putative c-di-GMP-specific phosphodiesterase class I)